MNSIKKKTTLIIAGILISYVLQMAPSPILYQIKDAYAIQSDTLLNLAVSSMFPTLIVASLIGERIESKVGTEKLYSLTLVLIIAGCILNIVAFNYYVFLIARIIYGAGFGFGIPFIGSAISKWYSKDGQEKMNTINGLFPFFGSMICFVIMDPLTNLLHGFKWALCIFALPVLIILLSWNGVNTISVKGNVTSIDGVYKTLLKSRDIRLLIVTFCCDFFCYSYIAAVLPTLIFEKAGGGITESFAGVLAAIAFPLSGVIGCVIGGNVSSRCGYRKPVLVAGQVLKFVGLVIGNLPFANLEICILGYVIYGFGNGAWMPIMYNIPMELDDVPKELVGAAFALISACGFVCGFISPSIGGGITDIVAASLDHVRGLQISLLIFNITNFISIISAVFTKETGPAKR